MGQHPSLMAGDGSVGVMSTTAISPPCKGVETTDQSNGIHSDKGSALSFRTAIDNFIESCLSNPSGNGENSQDETDSKQDGEDKPENKSNEENENKNESTDSNEPFEKDAPLSTDNATEESLDKAKTFSSFLQMRIRDMIVNCENNEDLSSYSGNQKPTPTSDSTTSTHTTSSCVSTNSVSTTSSTTSNTTVNATHSPTVTSLVPNSTMHSLSTPSVQSVTSKTLSPGYTKSEKSTAMTSVPLQALIDKVLDNSLGDENPSGKLNEPRIIDAGTSSNNSHPEAKQKNTASYEIAAESANFVREKVTRCVERNVNNAENAATKNEKQTGVLFMDHIEKVLVENFAEMNKKENIEKGIDREEPRKNIQPTPPAISNTPETESRMRQPRGDAPVSTESTIKHLAHGNLVMNPDGSNSVQAIVDRVISQTEVISKLLTPGSKQPQTATALNRTSDKPVASSRPIKDYDRINSRINTSQSQKSESYNEHIRQKEYHRPTELQKSSVTGFHPYHPREDYPKHGIVVSASGNNLSEQQSRYAQALNEKQMYHKGGLYPPSEVQDIHHVDQRLISETQRQKMIQENMAYISSRYPYHLNMPESGILSHPSMLRYCPPSAILPQRMPPPLLRIDGLMETGASPLVAHPYSKSCACVNCSAHRVQLEEVKKSPKQINHGLLAPSSNNFQSRLSPSSKEPKHSGTHSPLRYHNSAFTRTKDIPYPERGTPSKVHYDESPKQKKSRIDYGINMLYCEKRRQPDAYGISVREPSPSKSKYMSGPHSRLSDIHGPPEIKTPAIDTSLPNDQPLDLTKKKPKTVELQSQDYYRWQRGNHESVKNSYAHVSCSAHERRVGSVEIAGFNNEYHSPDKQFIKYERERDFPVHYGNKQEINRLQDTSASMTPGMMPEQLGSPGGRRPQLHPLPSPNLSTSYTHSAPTLNFSNSMSPTNGSPEGERNNESLNISRPPSQCSSNSPFDQDKDRRGSVSRHEPIQNIIGTHPPNDILYLICRLCRQTYGSPYGFRKHFRNQHGFEPRAEHTIVQTISATKSAMLHTPGMPHSPNNQTPNSVHGLHPSFQDCQVLDLADMPKVRERAASDSRLMKSSTYSETKSSRPTGSRSAECRRPSFKEESDNTKFLQCEQCKQTFQLNDFGSYKRHCRQHNQSRNLGAFHCQLCPSSFQEPQQLQEHMVKHDVESVVCKYCKVPYASRIYLEDHLRKVHGEETKTSNSCRHCQMSFIDYSEFLIHLQKVHGGLLSSEGANEKNTNIREEYHTKVSSVHVDIQPADQLTVITCPDSSSDYSSVSKDSCKVTNSTSDLKQTDSIKSTSVNETTSQDRCASVETRSYSNENSQDTVSSLANSDTGEESFYKHKKFFGHRKRKESSDILSVSPKCSRTDDGGSPKFNEVTSNANTKITGLSTFTSDSEKTCDTTAFNNSSVNSNNLCSLDTDRLQNKHEARHQMPFVWDRVTRSQAGKNIKPLDYLT